MKKRVTRAAAPIAIPAIAPAVSAALFDGAAAAVAVGDGDGEAMVLEVEVDVGAEVEDVVMPKTVAVISGGIPLEVRFT